MCIFSFYWNETNIFKSDFEFQIISNNISQMLRAEFYSFISGLTAFLGVFVIGLNSGMISPIIAELEREALVTTQSLPIFTSCYFLGSIIGHLSTGYIASLCRKKFLIITISMVLYSSNYVFLIGSNAVSVIAARFVLGVHDAIVFNLLIVYTGEVVMDTRKNVYCTGIGCALRVSTLMSFLLGIWIRYRFLIVFSMSCSIVCIVLMAFLPTSPHWLVKKGHFEKAKGVLLQMYQDQQVAEDKFNEIYNQQCSIQVDRVRKSSAILEKIKSLFKWSVLKPILIISSLQILKEASGHETIVSYCSVILSLHASASNTTGILLNENVQSLAYPSLLGLGSILSLLIVTRKRLKLILILTTLGQLIAHLSMTSYFLVSQSNLLNQYTGVLQSYKFVWAEVSIAMYGLFFSLGWGSAIYYLYVELFHPLYREVSCSVCCMAMTVSTFISVSVYGYVLEVFGGVVVFAGFSIACFSAILFQIFFL